MNNMRQKKRGSVSKGKLVNCAALFLVLSFLLNSVVWIEYSAKADDGDNLAAGKSVDTDGTWGTTGSKLLTDGKNMVSSGKADSLILKDGQWASVDLGSSQAFNQVVVYEYGWQRISGYLLEVSDDSEEWERVSESPETELLCKENPSKNTYFGTISFDTITGRYVRLTVKKALTSAGAPGGSTQINEIEVYSGSGVASTPGTESQGTASGGTPADSGVNLADSKTVTTNSTSYANSQSSPNTRVVTDGKPYVNTNASTLHVKDGNWVTIDLGADATVGRVVVYEHAWQRIYGAKVELSSDNSTWTVAAELSEADILCKEKGQMSGSQGTVNNYFVNITFAGTSARYVRVTVKKVINNNTASTAYIPEIEVYSGGGSSSGTGALPSEGGDKPSVDLATEDNAVNAMVGLGIMTLGQDGSFQPDNTVTRADFATIICRILNLEDAAKSNTKAQIFSDVPSTHPSAGHINTLYQLGIVKGMSDTEFSPSGMVTYEQALKTLVCVLGYEFSAESNGGYPDGYISVAAELKLLRGAGTIAYTESVKRYAIARIINNALETDIMTRVESGGVPNYVIQKGVNLLNDTLKVYKGEGIVTLVPPSEPYGASTLSDNQVLIDGIKYHVGATGAKDLLGYCVSFYYKEDTINSGWILVAVSKSAGKNNILTIDSKDIETASFDRIEYSINDDRISRASISAEAVVVYNGKIITTYLSSILKPENGYVTLLSNNGGSSYNYVFVWEYVNILVQNTVSNGYIIVDKYKNERNLSLNDLNIDEQVYIKKDGKAIKFEDIAPMDVVSVFADKMVKKNGYITFDEANATMYTLVVTTKSISGKVEEEFSDGRIIVNSTEYRYTDTYLDAQTPPEIGRECTFYLDAIGRIAGVDKKAETGATMGVVYDVKVVDGFTPKVMLKVYTLNDKHSVYALASRMFINKVPERDVTLQILENYGLITANGSGGYNTPKQLISFKTTAEGEISELNIAVDRANNADRSAVIERTAGSASRIYSSYLRKFRGTATIEEFTITGDAKIIIVPSGMDESQYEGTFQVTTISSAFVNGRTYEVEGYNTDEAGCATVVFLYRKAVLDSRGYLLFITKISDAINKDGVVSKKITGYLNGQEVSYFFTDDKLLYDFNSANSSSPLKEGDCIEVSTNRDNQINAFDRYVDYTKISSHSNNPNASAGMHILAGTLTETHGDYFKIKLLGDTLMDTRVYYLSGAKVYRYNISRQKGEMVSLDALVPGNSSSFIIMRLYSTRPREVVIYEVDE